jgi:hypothetical protein
MSVYKCHAFIFLDQPPPWPSRTSMSNETVSTGRVHGMKQRIFIRVCQTNSPYSPSLWNWTHVLPSMRICRVQGIKRIRVRGMKQWVLTESEKRRSCSANVWIEQSILLSCRTWTEINLRVYLHTMRPQSAQNEMCIFAEYVKRIDRFGMRI